MSPWHHFDANIGRYIFFTECIPRYVYLLQNIFRYTCHRMCPTGWLAHSDSEPFTVLLLKSGQNAPFLTWSRQERSSPNESRRTDNNLFLPGFSTLFFLTGRTLRTSVGPINMFSVDVDFAFMPWFLPDGVAFLHLVFSLTTTQVLIIESPDHPFTVRRLAY